MTPIPTPHVNAVLSSYDIYLLMPFSSSYDTYSYTTSSVETWWLQSGRTLNLTAADKRQHIEIMSGQLQSRTGFIIEIS